MFDFAKKLFRRGNIIGDCQQSWQRKPWIKQN